MNRSILKGHCERQLNFTLKNQGFIVRFASHQGSENLIRSNTPYFSGSRGIFMRWWNDSRLPPSEVWEKRNGSEADYRGMHGLHQSAYIWDKAQDFVATFEGTHTRMYIHERTHTRMNTNLHAHRDAAAYTNVRRQGRDRRRLLYFVSSLLLLTITANMLTLPNKTIKHNLHMFVFTYANSLLRSCVIEHFVEFVYCNVVLLCSSDQSQDILDRHIFKYI